MTRGVITVYEFFSKHGGWLCGLLALLVVLLACSAYHIRFKEDIARFLPENKENERVNNAYQYVASSNTITVSCRIDHDFFDSSDSNNSQLLIAAVDALVGRLEARLDSTVIKSIFYKVDTQEMLELSSFVVENMPYFLGEDDYRRLDSLVTRAAITRQLDINRGILSSLGGAVVKNNILKDPLQLAAEVIQKLQNFKVDDRFQLYDDHLFDEDNQAILFVESALSASETGRNALFLDTFKLLIAETEKEFPGVIIESFSASEIGLSNARQIQKDTLFSMSLAVCIILALMIYAFRSGRKIMLVFASVGFGGLLSLAALNLISGDVSIIAIGISSIMFGIAINYPLHFLEYHSHAPDTQTILKDVAEPLTIGNITTVGAFLSLVFIGSDAMKDLGLFAAFLLIGTIFFVLFFLPHFLPVKKNCLNGMGDYPPAKKSLFEQLIARPFEKNRILVAVIIVMTVFFSFFSGDTCFETDMQKINYMTASHKKSFEKMMDLLNNNQHVMYHVTEGKDLETVLAVSEQRTPLLQSLVDANKIYRIGGIGDFFPSRTRQTSLLKRWEDFWSTRRDSVVAIFSEEAQKAGFREEAFASFIKMLFRSWDVVDVSHFNPLRETVAKNYIVEKGKRAAVIHLLYMDAAKAPEIETLLNDTILPLKPCLPTGRGAGGYENPREQKEDSVNQLINFSRLQKADEAYSIAFDAGTITRRMVSSLSEQFDYVLWVCGIIVFAFLLFSFGRIELSLIAFLPLALSWIWILGIMNLFDIRFNIVNIILATFIFGQGDDYTILMTEGMMHEYAYRRKILTSYKKSITLSALIMLTGMGMLIFARHPALRSLAEVTIVGMLTVVIMAYILPSLLFRLLTMRKGQKRLMPVTLLNLLSLIYSFLVFLVLSTLITLTGWIMFTFGRRTEKKKLLFHKILCRITKFVIYRVPQVKTVCHNLSGETFDKPGVIICNHQAHLDLMCIMMLTPKLIILTNDWVWNSPFYGRMIKYADYYPVSNGIEKAMVQLQDAIRRGYSIVVFPEGTRSPDCTIKRFHRGAFYLAELLQLDLIPVMLHGVGHVLPKNEFMLRKGQIHIQIMPRITPDDSRFSQGYSSRSREVRRYYQTEYQKMCDAIETPAYYADLVMKNYLYKGSAIEREVRRNLKQHNNYATEIASMPDEGEITLPNTGYGEYPLLLSLVKKRLKITALEPDPDRFALASNCASIPPTLTFRHGDGGVGGSSTLLHTVH